MYVQHPPIHGKIMLHRHVEKRKMLCLHWHSFFPQVIKASDKNELQSLLVEDEYSFIAECGFMKPHSKISMNDVPDIVRSVCMKFVVIRSTLNFRRAWIRFLLGPSLNDTLLS